jgi:hypothetical protein
MQSLLLSQRSAYDLIQLLDEHTAGIDPDFDAHRDDLEFEFAALRLTLDRNQ